MIEGRSTIVCLEDLPGAQVVSLEEDLVPATVIRRVNRFVAEVEICGEVISAHVPNSGRLPQVLEPGLGVLLADRRSSSRKTDFDVLFSRPENERGEPMQWALVDSRMPMSSFDGALELGMLPEFGVFHGVRREVTLGDSRIDYLLEDRKEDRRCWVEIKSVTLTFATPWGVEARFPDSPTTRGTRHVRELTGAVGDGVRCAVAFAVSRPEATCFAPNAGEDPAFARALWEASLAGVEVYAYRLVSDPAGGVSLDARIPVRIVEPGQI